MSKQILAITTCRVSTSEQEANKSLDRQAEAVKRAALELGATIPKDGQWSGSVSSKVGTNVKRKDLKEMLDYCKKNPAVKYLIVHEVDRFMRSVDELFYFEVLFRSEVDVKIIYASQPQLNTDDYNAKLFKALEAFKGETSNVERINKCIDGQSDALREGRYPFAIKPGYKKGYEKGIQEIHPIRGPALKTILIKIAESLVTPSQGLVELNNSNFVIGYSQYKMDKFRKILEDSFYAGIVEVDKQIKVRNENGLHEPLITIEQHNKLFSIMDKKKKHQSGPNLEGNPKYPLSNFVSCRRCEHSSNGRVAGLDLTNGKTAKKYEKYRCRSCKKYQNRDDLHEKIKAQFDDHQITPKGREDLLEALNIVWKQQEGQAEQEVIRIRHKISNLNQTISQQVEAATDPAIADIKKEILCSIAKKKNEIISLEDRLKELTQGANNDKEQFLKFAFRFVDKMGSNFLDINLVSKENRLRCKQLVFPGGFWLDENDKVYTPEISPLYRLAGKKKDTEVSDISHVVQQVGKSLHLIRGEVVRWREILAVPYQEYLLSK